MLRASQVKRGRRSTTSLMWRNPSQDRAKDTNACTNGDADQIAPSESAGRGDSVQDGSFDGEMRRDADAARRRWPRDGMATAVVCRQCLRGDSRLVLAEILKQHQVAAGLNL